MRLAIIDTNEKARILLELSQEEFLARLKEALARHENIDVAFKEVAEYLKSLTVSL